jgi:hypothetical protein
LTPFPCASRFARGGRGGKVIHVTSLEDTEDEGTLRYALTVAEGPRIVVFDVGGVITTTSRMSVNDQYLTVAGQTAPGKGIVVQGFPVGLTGARDIIFRHMRVRPGKISGQTIDGMGMQGSNNCIFDRCSVVCLGNLYSLRKSFLLPPSQVVNALLTTRRDGPLTSPFPPDPPGTLPSSAP